MDHVIKLTYIIFFRFFSATNKTLRTSKKLSPQLGAISTRSRTVGRDGTWIPCRTFRRPKVPSSKLGVCLDGLLFSPWNSLSFFLLSSLEIQSFHCLGKIWIFELWTCELNKVKEWVEESVPQKMAVGRPWPTQKNIVCIPSGGTAYVDVHFPFALPLSSCDALWYRSYAWSQELARHGIQKRCSRWKWGNLTTLAEETNIGRDLMTSQNPTEDLPAHHFALRRAATTSTKCYVVKLLRKNPLEAFEHLQKLWQEAYLWSFRYSCCSPSCSTSLNFKDAGKLVPAYKTMTFRTFHMFNSWFWRCNFHHLTSNHFLSMVTVGTNPARPAAAASPHCKMDPLMIETKVKQEYTKSPSVNRSRGGRIVNEKRAQNEQVCKYLTWGAKSLDNFETIYRDNGASCQLCKSVFRNLCEEWGALAKCALGLQASIQNAGMVLQFFFPIICLADISRHGFWRWNSG